MYRAIIRYPLEDVEMRELYDNKEDARLDAMISVAFRYMEAEKLYKSDPEMFKCAEEYVLHAKLVLRKVDGEEKKGKDFLFKNLQKFANNKSFVEKMQYETHEPGDVLLLTGVGEVFPFMRIHSLLEALQPEFPDIPILVMYPGKYDGRFVRLFDKLEANPYYRAFNIVGGSDK